jgi:hypothetical protein
LKQRLVEGIRVVVLEDRAPTDDQWAQHLAESLASVDATRGVLVFSLTTGPTSKQRSALAKFPVLVAQRTAVVATSALARGIVTAFSWLGSNTRPFSPQSMDRAFDFLGVAPASRKPILHAIESMQSEFRADRASVTGRRG